MLKLTEFIYQDDVNQLCSSNNMKGYATHYLLNKKSGQTVLIDSIPNERYVSEYILEEKDGVTYSTAPSLAPFVWTSDGIVYAELDASDIMHIPVTKRYYDRLSEML